MRLTDEEIEGLLMWSKRSEGAITLFPSNTSALRELQQARRVIEDLREHIDQDTLLTAKRLDKSLAAYDTED